MFSSIQNKQHKGISCTSSSLSTKEDTTLFIQKKENINKSSFTHGKFIVRKSNDRYEQQANNAAKAVMQSKKVDRSQITSVSKSSIQKKATSNKQTSDPSSLASQLENSKGKGFSLPNSTNTSMSDAFGTNFSHVKIHNDHAAQHMNHQLNSRAFTNGNDIYFNSGEYMPETPKGKRLLAHELTHVIQQKRNTSHVIQKQDDDDIPVSQNVIDLAPLSWVPRFAHQRWPELNENQRTIVFYGMIDHYGIVFASQFWELANAGVHNYRTSYLNRTAQRRNIRYRDEVILAEGFINAGVTQDTDAFGNVLSVQDEVWIHPDGRMIFVTIQNPTNVAPVEPQQLVPEVPDVTLQEPTLRIPERQPPTIGGGDRLHLEGQPPTRSNRDTNPHRPRLEGGGLRPPNFDDLRLGL